MLALQIDVGYTVFQPISHALHTGNTCTSVALVWSRDMTYSRIILLFHPSSRPAPSLSAPLFIYFKAFEGHSKVYILNYLSRSENQCWIQPLLFPNMSCQQWSHNKNLKFFPTYTWIHKILKKIKKMVSAKQCEVIQELTVDLFILASFKLVFSNSGLFIRG